MGNNVVISNLSKEYSLKNAVSRIKPLDNVSLNIGEGEVVGIVGGNGSGKSTLLKIISGLTRPTSGTIRLVGNVSSILDIESNFHPELTGYENAKMLLQLNNFSLKKKSETLRQIRAFSDIGDFFYQPLKTYSNGMFLRLAFSVVFNTPADILVLDEVLSVGDEAFKMKSFAFIKQLRQQGKTIILVSHSRQEILELCSRSVWLQDGKIKMDDLPNAVVSAYFEAQKKKFETEENKREGKINVKYENEDGTIDVQWGKNNAIEDNDVALKKVKIFNQEHPCLYTANPITIQVVVENKNSDKQVSLSLIFHDHFLQPIFYISPLNSIIRTNNANHYATKRGMFEFSCTIPSNFLNKGQYYISLQLAADETVAKRGARRPFLLEKAFKIRIDDIDNHESISELETELSILPFLDWKITTVE